MEDLQIFKPFTVKSSIKGSYSVEFIIDLRDELHTQLLENNVIFVIDEKVRDLFKSELEEVLSKARVVYIRCEENTKTIDYCQGVINDLIDLNVRRDDKLIVIGGGIAQDIIAFVSSILFRGIEWRFFPTTLLAQCDSCIGSKSSINFKNFKNLVGTFNPPSNIYIYYDFLKTLTTSEIKSGLGEMLHYFFTEGLNLAKELSDNYDSLLENYNELGYFIANSLRIKKNIIELDEFDKSLRHIFNYGHTFGHGIEAITNYSIPHGQAVSIGMDLANFISFKIGMLEEQDFYIMHSILKKNIPPFNFNEDNILSYLEALSRDKKNIGNKLGCILSERPGMVKKVFLNIDDELKGYILEYSMSYAAK